MYHSEIERIDTLQRTRLHVVGWRKGRLHFPTGPSTKADGLYWIYTDHTDQDFLDSSPSVKERSINFASMTRRHARLRNICRESVDRFRLVYNGVGGLGNGGYGGLRERILEEYRGGRGTGSLAITGSSLNDLTRWRVSFVLWSEMIFEEPHDYMGHSASIEQLWRLHYGWPLLCKK